MKYCPNCMSELENENSSLCYQCGFDHHVVEQPEYALPYQYLLHERYIIGKVLGQGGFGITYVGYDTVLNVKVAIKEYFPTGIAMRQSDGTSSLIWDSSQASQSKREHSYETFLVEARKMAKIDQITSIVRVRDTFTENETAYIIMDFVEGITLKQKLKEDGLMSYKNCVKMLMPMMKDLELVHKHGIIHKDISPDNIMIQPDGSIRLLDLGAAADTSVSAVRESHMVTKKGFSPIEQYSAKGNIGPWTDVYAMCATIYYCITGKVLPASIERMGSNKLDMPKEVKDTLSVEEFSALKNGLSVEIKNRIQSMDELYRRLTVNISTKKPKKFLKWMAVSLLAVCAVAVLVFFGMKLVDAKKLKVEAYGCPNANMMNGSFFAEIGKQYEYYVAADNALYIITYDDDDECFYIDSGVHLFDEAGYINLSKDMVYFASEQNGEIGLYQMNPDGSAITMLHTTEEKHIAHMQYVKLTDGKEYLYFLTEEDEDGIKRNLHRYDVQQGTVELLLEGVYWINLYKDSLYYITVEFGETLETKLYRAKLNGEDAKLLDDEHSYYWGFVENDTMFMLSFQEEALFLCDLTGKQKENDKLYELEIDFNGSLGYGDGWIYYSSKSDNSIHRVRENGTGNECIVEGHTPVNLNVVNNYVYYTNKVQDSYGEGYESYIVFRDGSEHWSMSEMVPVLDVEFAKEEEFSYEINQSGNGIVITGYTGESTEFKIPGKINGLPIVEIGDRAFYEGEITKIAIPNTVKRIGEYAFYDCEALEIVKLPLGLEEIAEGAFGSCWSLTQIRLPESLRTIERTTFAETQIEAFYIGENVSQIGSAAFAVTSSTEFLGFEVSEYNKSYAQKDGVLYTSNMNILVSCPSGLHSAYTIPNGVGVIKEYAFAHCANLAELTIPDSVYMIQTNAFWDCKSLSHISVNEDCIVPQYYGNDVIISYIE